jgi:hypothetical protein
MGHGVKRILILFIFYALCPMLSASLVLAQTAMVPPPIAAETHIGIAAAVRGQVKLVNAGQAGIVIESGRPIYLGDEISTDSEGTLQVLLLDQTVFTIGPNSTLVIDAFIYDPATETGKVKAAVAKGVFRFVTGKIARKNPEDMEVDVPTGTIGIRGTIVAGEVEGSRALIVLLGPGENNNTGSKEGAVLLQAKGSGEKLFVARTGFGAVLESGKTPGHSFKVSGQDLGRIHQKLRPAGLLQPRQGPPPGLKPPGDRRKSPSEQAGQDKAGAGKPTQQMNRTGRLFQGLRRESNRAAQRFLDKPFRQLLDGPSSRDQLHALAQKIGGIHHFTKTSLTSGGGTISVNFDIHFGSRNVGGGNSGVTGTTGGGENFSFPLGPRPFGFGSENAAYDYPLVNNVLNGAGNCPVCRADIKIGLNNRGGEIAKDANVGLIVRQGGNVLDTANTNAPRVPGSSP